MKKQFKNTHSWKKLSPAESRRMLTINRDLHKMIKRILATEKRLSEFRLEYMEYFKELVEIFAANGVPVPAELLGSNNPGLYT